MAILAYSIDCLCSPLAYVQFPTHVNLWSIGYSTANLLQRLCVHASSDYTHYTRSPDYESNHSFLLYFRQHSSSPQQKNEYYFAHVLCTFLALTCAIKAKLPLYNLWNTANLNTLTTAFRDEGARYFKRAKFKWVTSQVEGLGTRSRLGSISRAGELVSGSFITRILCNNAHVHIIACDGIKGGMEVKLTSRYCNSGSKWNGMPSGEWKSLSYIVVSDPY